jgi:hypothetical protein
MRRILICTGILGGGTALTFGAAVLAAALLPGGTVVPASSMFQGGGGWVGHVKGGPGIAAPMPAPMNPGDVITVPESPAP